MNKRTAYIAAIFLVLAFGLSPLLAGSVCGDPGCGMPCGMSVMGTVNSSDTSRFASACCCGDTERPCSLGIPDVSILNGVSILPHYPVKHETMHASAYEKDLYPSVSYAAYSFYRYSLTGSPEPVPLFLKNRSMIL